jgi:hypothetical protein
MAYDYDHLISRDGHANWVVSLELKWTIDLFPNVETLDSLHLWRIIGIRPLDTQSSMPNVPTTEDTMPGHDYIPSGRQPTAIDDL